MPHVLVVDDEPNILLSLEFLMQQAGFSVATAPDAEQALALINQHCPDLLLLDISLPGMSGFDLLERLRADAATRQLPVVMLTAHGRDVEKEKGMALGASDYVTKPFSTRELVSRVQQLLGDGPQGG
ncbi:response regulator transcription factor [Marinobacterium weihaiense]|uniref:Response regulator n=1 Tax=Marinobacterium weihaiense TaxID=2851016 RepID=A0ABS6MCS3_9GAMM|nr:response regulator [Marinobacterium weihaiense]MBV0933679.1 response regulator [Marinobacterium weihaiense]